MKYLLFISALFVFSAGSGQDLRQFVPSDAIFVGSINGSNILETVTISELDQSKLGRKLLQESSDKLGFQIASLNDLGINTSAHTYFYYAANDSLTYTTFVAPLKNSLFLDHLAAKEGNEVKDNGKFKYMRLSGGNYLAWDNQKILKIEGRFNYAYFNEYDFSAIEAEVAANPEEFEGLYEKLSFETVEEYNSADGDDDVSEQSYDYDEEVVEMQAPPASGPGEEITRDYVPYLYNYQLQLYADRFYQFCENVKTAAENNDQTAIKNLQYEVEALQDLAANVDSITHPDPQNLDDFVENKTYYAKIAVEQVKDNKAKENLLAVLDDATFKSDAFIVYEDQYDAYDYGDYKDYYIEKLVLEDRWTENMLETVMASSANSISANQQYLAQYDSKAAINVWNSNLGSTLASFYSGISTAAAVLGTNLPGYDFFYGYGEFSSNLYLEGTRTRIGADITLSEDFAKKFGRMGKQKINKKFFKYINEDNLMGYMTYKINSKSFLEEYPSILAQTYSPLWGGPYNEDMKLGMAIFSLVLDEEAVSKLITGDVYFGLSGINDKEVTYFDYEYDEDYNYTEVEKTKMEKLPEFIVMATTKDKDFTSKLITYLTNKALIEPQNGYYKILDPYNDIPLDLYFVIKNDIFFLTTSSTEISAIVADNFKAKLSGKHKKMMKAGNFSAFFNGTKLGQQFPYNETNLPNDNLTKFAMENASDFYLKSSKVKNRKIHTELIMQIPDHQKNLINYIMSFVEHW